MDTMDWSALAVAVDEQVYRPPSDRDVCARMYGVVVAGGDVTAPTVRLLEKGEGQRLLRKTRLPSGLTAMAMTMGGWRAPMEEDGSMVARPRAHPQRQRIHSTGLVAGEGVLVTVLRTASADPNGDVLVLPGGQGRVPDAMRACWLRAKAREAGRPEADGLPWRMRV
jgi:hypothetical protein